MYMEHIREDKVLKLQALNMAQCQLELFFKFLFVLFIAYFDSHMNKMLPY